MAEHGHDGTALAEKGRRRKLSAEEKQATGQQRAAQPGEKRAGRGDMHVCATSTDHAIRRPKPTPRNSPRNYKPIHRQRSRASGRPKRSHGSPEETGQRTYFVTNSWLNRARSHSRASSTVSTTSNTSNSSTTRNTSNTSNTRPTRTTHTTRTTRTHPHS